MFPPARRRGRIAENRPRGRGWARRPKCHVACWHETDLPTGADDVLGVDRKSPWSGQADADDPKRTPCMSYFVSRREKRKLQWLAPPASVWVRSKRMPRVA